ncbi:response regulator transcription factor [Nocardia vinacea]|uniref:Response regulator transcription factor n=2 Tax=Nocardia vinacea TaxID=96468 RepID=A0ABZ1Z6T9_9NOCA|nr:response regulator transcription factor [Nocardia vinacea]
MLRPAAGRRLIDRYHASDQGKTLAAQARFERLTPRERDVLKLLAEGETNADIATHLSMRESTVKAHISRILTVLEVTNRVQAALVARDANIACPPRCRSIETVMACRADPPAARYAEISTGPSCRPAARCHRGTSPCRPRTWATGRGTR